MLLFKPVVLSTLLIALFPSALRDELELHLGMSELCFQKAAGIHSAPYIQVLIFQLGIAWETVF
jgi:hypothetical protein